MDKLSSTDAGLFSDAKEEINRPHIIIRKIEVDKSNDYESEMDTPISGLGGLSSQRSLTLSKMSSINKEHAKDFIHVQSKQVIRNAKKIGKSVLYPNNSAPSGNSRNLFSVLDTFVA